MRWSVKPKSEWKRWFAWYPVRVRDQWVWLEQIFVRSQANEGGGLTVVFSDKEGVR